MLRVNAKKRREYKTHADGTLTREALANLRAADYHASSARARGGASPPRKMPGAAVNRMIRKVKSGVNIQMHTHIEPYRQEQDRLVVVVQMDKNEDIAYLTSHRSCCVLLRKQARKEINFM